MSATTVLAPPRAADDSEIRILSLRDLAGATNLDMGEEIEVTDMPRDTVWFGRIIEIDRGAEVVIARELFSFDF